jgi:hypothetical protein
MEDKTRALIVTGAVLLLILGLIIAAIFYLIRFISGRSTTNTSQNQTRQINFSPSPTANIDFSAGSTNPVPGGNVNNSDLKTHNGSGFQISYPKNWGLLTCSNSVNVEFDPANPTDQLKVTCDYAQKPITVMVGVSCEGATTDVGGVPVVKSKRNLSKGVENSWCVKVGSGFLITNRVSNQDARGYGREDYGRQIDEMIARLRVGNAS